MIECFFEHGIGCVLILPGSTGAVVASFLGSISKGQGRAVQSNSAAGSDQARLNVARDARAPAQSGFLRNTAFSLGQQVTAMALAIVLVPYMLWSLGPEKYGLWLILQLFNILGLASLAELGLHGAILRYLTRHFIEGDRRAFRQVLSGGLILFVGIGAIAGGGTIVFANTALTAIFPIASEHHAEMRLGLTVIGAGLLAGFPALIIKAYFASRQNLAMTKVWEVCDRMIFATGVFVLLQMSTSIAALIIFEQVLAIGLTIVFAIIARRGSGGWFTFSRAAAAGAPWRGLIQLSKSVFAANLASQGFNRMPEFFVGAMLGPVTLASYQIATRIPRVIKTLQGSLNAAVLPHIAGIDALNAGDGGEARAQFALLGLRVNYIIAAPMLLGCSLLAPTVLSIWVGEEYRDLAGYMAAFAVFHTLFLASNYCGATLTRHEHFRVFVRVNLGLLLGFIAGLALGLAPMGLGFLFAALVISGAALFFSALIVLRGSHGIAIGDALRQAVWGPVLLSGAIGLLLLGPGTWLLAMGQWALGAGALVGGGVLYLLAIIAWVLSRSERAALAAMLPKLLPRCGVIAPD